MPDLAELARRQHGALSLQQLAAQGISQEEARRRVRRGEWRRLRSGVVGVTRPSTELGSLAQAAWAVLV
ncbi:MAG TPA: type IV toxin-antitoxin system AbiEi family antitoxin domain-containing protein, partial [Mycobacteriales bacterium]|nr:type IV toxin-antitoxin system AbiEi family antitoxin domain-containing protein [Mycobacteriales bacterium]